MGVVSSPDLIRRVYRYKRAGKQLKLLTLDTESDPRWGWFWVWDRD